MCWLKTMDFPCEDSAFIHGDKQSFLWNTSIPQSILKKENNSIAYDLARDGVDRDEHKTTLCNAHDEEANLLKQFFLQERRGKALWGVHFTKCVVRGSFIFFCDRCVLAHCCRLSYHRFGCVLCGGSSCRSTLEFFMFYVLCFMFTSASK